MLPLSDQQCSSMALHPNSTHRHHETEIATTELLSDIRFFSITVESTPLVRETLDRDMTRQHNDSGRPEDEGEGRTISASPLLRLYVRVMTMHLTGCQGSRFRRE